LLERAAAWSRSRQRLRLPLLETRVLARRRWPATLPHSTCSVLAARLTGCFDDCRLGTLERDVLGLSREEDVPGR